MKSAQPFQITTIIVINIQSTNYPLKPQPGDLPVFNTNRCCLLRFQRGSVSRAVPDVWPHTAIGCTSSMYGPRGYTLPFEGLCFIQTGWLLCKFSSPKNEGMILLWGFSSAFKKCFVSRTVQQAFTPSPGWGRWGKISAIWKCPIEQCVCMFIPLSEAALRITPVSTGTREGSLLICHQRGCLQHDAEHIMCLRLALLRTSLEDFLRRPWINTALVLPFGEFLLKP